MDWKWISGLKMSLIPSEWPNILKMSLVQTPINFQRRLGAFYNKSRDNNAKKHKKREKSEIKINKREKGKRISRFIEWGRLHGPITVFNSKFLNTQRKERWVDCVPLFGSRVYTSSFVHSFIHFILIYCESTEDQQTFHWSWSHFLEIDVSTINTTQSMVLGSHLSSWTSDLPTCDRPPLLIPALQESWQALKHTREHRILSPACDAT